jgi:hypothetical protein
MKLIITLSAVANTLITMSFAQSTSALTPEFHSDLRMGYEMKSEDLVRHNAVTNKEINKLALNRQIISGEDGQFSHKSKQKASPTRSHPVVAG